MRRTIIVANGFAASGQLLDLARQNQHGTAVKTVQQAAERLAGGFLRVIDGDTLLAACRRVIEDATLAQLGDLHGIADLPGLPAALATALGRIWQAGLDLAEWAHQMPDQPRLATLAGLEACILAQLPAGLMRPADLAQAALQRLPFRATVFGSVSFGRLLHVAPCWQALMRGLGWQPEEPPSGSPAVLRAVTCATARHEVVEALRWARGLLARGIPAHQIAFAAASPGEYDDLLQASAPETGLKLFFAQGLKALNTADGQAMAALATILLHGLSQDRVRRLAKLAHAPGTPFGSLPPEALRALPPGAPLGTAERWRQATANWAEDRLGVLLPAIDLLAAGPARATEAGALFLRGRAAQLWQRALASAPPTALESAFASLRLPDEGEAATSIVWVPASVLATAARPYVWLFGLNARSWPRGAAEDPLLPDHILPAQRLIPVTITQQDRTAFAVIRATTEGELVCSASRRDATGRLLGLSPLMPKNGAIERLRRSRIPADAMSEQDRLVARPQEFAATLRARSAHACWQNWNSRSITAHDGLVRPGHPVVERALSRVHSASSLRTLLRNPLGFVWRYGLRLKAPDASDEALDLDNLQFGELVHAMLEAALPGIQAAGGFGRVQAGRLDRILQDARRSVATTWEAERAVPPAILWQLRLDEARGMANRALAWPMDHMADVRSYSELAFGQREIDGESSSNAPWRADRPVFIPGTDIKISGRIDRLDLSANGRQARVVDYKTGKPRDPGVVNGGAELQRCLYTAAVQSLLGDEVRIEAALMFPRGDGAYYTLPDAHAALDTVRQAVLCGIASLREGRAIFGPDTGGGWDDLAFALPCAPGTMLDHKRQHAAALLGEAALIWEQD